MASSPTETSPASAAAAAMAGAPAAPAAEATPSQTATPVTPTASTAPPPAAPKAARYLSNDPQRTGYDPSMKWWMNYFRILSGQMTPEGQFHYREDRYRHHEARDCLRCEEYRDWAFRLSPVVRFLRDKVSALNGDLGPHNVRCRRCPARVADDGRVSRQAGGFDPRRGILLCANDVRDRRHLEDTLAHEMVHAWDHLRWRVDWAGASGDRGLRQAACAEIRASMLSGECRWAREALVRGNYRIAMQFQNCVRMRAVQSLLARPSCRDDVHAVKLVNSVWDSCFADTRPFDEVYR